ncbi:MAG: fucose isomerase [Bacteroidota bacterium]
MKTIYLVANGDLRLAANQNCETAQIEMEKQIAEAVERLGGSLQRAHSYDPEKKHGFIDSQKYGMEVFGRIPSKAPLIVAEAVWQYSHHILAGLFTHRGPILTVANWSGTWPGLVGLLNLNGSLTKAGVTYSTLWSEDFTDDFFMSGLKRWIKTGSVKQDTSHVAPYKKANVPAKAEKMGREFGKRFKSKKAIMGVFDEGCMGMYNAIIPDELLHKTGIFKERLSQSTLYAKMLTVPDSEARNVYDWLIARGVHFDFGADEITELTEGQVLQQCKMYIAAVRLASEFGCATIGIQYQQGLKDLTPASDLAEGLLNNVDRPPVHDEQTGRELFAGEALPHFNEVDECAGLDALITYRLWRELGFPPENTLHDLRWGRWYKENGINDFVWVLEISGAAPPEHFVEGYAGTKSERQPPMYFRLGGGTLKGVSKPGHIVWSRVFVANGRLNYDTGLGNVVELPQRETEERWRLTSREWPIMHAKLKGITRDQMMARHKSNHIHVVYAPDAASARKGMFAKAAAMRELGLKVYFCGATR